jgi:hypothetical protein
MHSTPIVAVTGFLSVITKFPLTQMITVAERSPHTTHTTDHIPHPNPQPRPYPAIHSSSQNILFACPTISASISSGLVLPASAIIPFICALILIFSSTSSMLTPHLLAILPISSDCPISNRSVGSILSLLASNIIRSLRLRVSRLGSFTKIN